MQPAEQVPLLEEGFRLSPQQRRIWRLTGSREAATYRSGLAAALDGALDPERLRSGLLAAVAEHEILRTVFHLPPSATLPLQRIEEEARLDWMLEDLSPAKEEEPSVLLASWMRRRVPSVEEGPVLRARCLRRDEGRHLLLLDLPSLNGDLATLRLLLAAAGAAGGGDEVYQYADLAEWQNGLLESEDTEAGRQFWRRMTAEEARGLRLPFAELRPAHPFDPSVLRLALDPGLAKDLAALADEAGADPEGLLLACWNACLAGSLGVGRLVTGVRFAGRRYPELEAALGPLERLLPVSFEAVDGETVADAARRTAGRIEEVSGWQEYFERDEDAGPEADPPLPFGYGFRLSRQLALWGGDADGGVEVTVVAESGGGDRADAECLVSWSDDAPSIDLRFDRSVLSSDEAEVLGRRFETLLEAAARAPETPLAALPRVPEAERRRLFDLAGGGVETAEAPGLLERFEARAEAHPDRVAVRLGDTVLTFGGLAARARHWSARLRELGVGPEVRVGLVLERSADCVAAILAVLRAGGAYVPVEPGSPVERLRAMAADACCVLWLSDGALEVDGAPCLTLAELDAGAGGPAREGAPDEPPPRPDPRSLAYVMFTSGSTGRPKGVGVEHRNLAHYLAAVSERLALLGSPSFATVSTFAADLGHTMVFGALATGGCLHVVPAESVIDPEELADYFEVWPVDCLKIVPSHLEALLTSPRGLDLLPARLLVTGGEALRWETAERIKLLAPGLRLLNHYGPTETTVGVTTSPADLAYRRTGAGTVPIGLPLRGTRVHVVGPALDPVPLGAPGELVVGGASPARGYVGRPAATAERFVPDPLSGEPGARLYRTGDRVRHLPDGRLEFLGRTDRQLKIRGFRVEPGELEACLEAHPGVGRAVAAARELPGAGTRLVAWAVPDPVTAAPAGRMLRWERDGSIDGVGRLRLPDGMEIFHLNPNESAYMYEEIFQQRSYLRHGVRLGDSPCVFDVGANIGMFSLFVGRVSRSPRLFAFEPIPVLADLLRRNSSLHGLDAEVFECGLSSEAGTSEFSFYPHLSLMSGRHADLADEEEVVRTFLAREGRSGEAGELLDELLAERLTRRTVEARLRTLSEVIAEQGVERIDLLKIDVQKSELEVLEGLEEEDWARVRQVVAEVHALGDRLERVQELLARHGFRTTVEQERALESSPLHLVYAVRGGDDWAAEAEHPPAAVWSSPDVLRAELEERAARDLPEPLRPAAIVLVDRIPLTPNGKVDLGALPMPRLGQADQEEDEGPRGEVELAVASIWSELLGLERVPRKRDFFRLGGHSLLATQVVSRLRKSFGVEVSLREFFRRPTVAALAEILERQRRPEAGEETPPIEPIPRDGGLELSFAQHRLWFLEQLAPGRPTYNMPMAMRFRGPLHGLRLEAALTEVVRRHEVLRTTFATDAGRPRQEVHPPGFLRLRTADLRGLAPERREVVARRLADAEAQRPFDLEAGPIFRTTLLRLDDEDHVALFTVHHIAGDGWSMTLLVREVKALYETVTAGGPAGLPELDVQYADFAHWQRRRLSGERLESELAWWVGQLGDGVGNDLELPYDRPRPAHPSYRGASRDVILDRDLSRDLRELGRKEGTTLHMTSLAAFQVLLHRYTGEPRISVGIPVAGRTRTEVEPLIGFFVNTLTLRTDLSGDPSFEEVLRRVRDLSLAAQDHQELPFERIVEELAPRRDADDVPLFRVVMLLQNIPQEEMRFSGVEAGPFDRPDETAKFDLTLGLVEVGRSIVGSLQYSTDRFDGATSLRLLRQYRTLLRDAVARPEAPITRLSLLDAAEEAQLLREWNDTGAPVGAGLAERVAARAGLTPDAVAVEAGDLYLSFAELTRRGEVLARRLRRLGVGPEVLVGLGFERGDPALVIGMLAVLGAGGAFVPLDPDYPAERLRTMIDGAGVGIVLVRERLRERFAVAGVRLVAPEGDPREEGGPPAPEPEPENLAYAIFTSGTTGRPKTAALDHRGLANLVLAHGIYGAGPGFRGLQFASPSFDASLYEIVMSLSWGGTVLLAPLDRALPGPMLDRFLRRRRVDAATLTPSTLEVLSASADGPPVVTSVGEACSAELVDRWAPGRLFRNAYGPTEATCWATVARCRPGSGTPTVGRPVANVACHVTDARLELLPAGAVGELWIGGTGVGRGYLDEPATTALSFVPDPFGGSPGARLYRSGDRVRRRHDGELEFLGRLDDQVKVRGFRIEPGEVESHLRELPEVARVAVVARDAGSAAARLVAYVVPADGHRPSSAALRDRLSHRLPPHMVPSAFVVLDELPTTAAGKLDRRALPEPADHDLVAGTPPRTPTEGVVAAVWQEVLGLPEIDVHAEFFDIGGHSLLATQVVARLRESLGVEVSVRTLFEAPTVASLAARAEAAGAADAPSLPPIVPSPRAGEAPLSFGQQRLWFLDRLDPGSPALNIHASFLLSGKLVLPALAAAFDRVVARHAVLHTVYPATRAGVARQRAEPASWPGIGVIDLEALPTGSRWAALRRLVRDERLRGFDLARGPVLRVRVVRLDAERSAALFTLHHIAGDGWSMKVVVDELAEAYRAATEHRPARLPELPIQYADYARWQAEVLRGEALDALVSYWRDHLDGAPAHLDLATDRPRPAVQTQRGGRVVARLAAGPIDRLAREAVATPFMVLLAAFGVLLSRHTGQADAVIGAPVAGRRMLATEPLVGFFVNTLPLRVTAPSDAGFRQVVAAARSAGLGGHLHQDLPFERLVEELDVPRDAARTPVFQATLVFQNTPSAVLELPGLEVSDLADAAHTAQFELSLTAVEEGDGLTCGLTYNSDLFDRTTARRLLGQLSELLDVAVEEPDRPVGELPMLGAAAHHQVLREWSGAARPARFGGAAHEAFERIAERLPETVALEADGSYVSYRELAARTHRLAERLRRAGAGSEERVALLVERGLDLPTAVLAVLRAGAAYLPLDPEDPPERMARLVADSGARLALTQTGLAGRLPGSLPGAVPVPVLTIEPERESIGRADEWRAPLSRPSSPDALAYLIYTSGSTGRPKGVMGTHGALANRLAHFAADPESGPGERYLLKTPATFDVSVWEMLAPLTTGASLLVSRPDGHRDPSYLARLIQERRVTACHFVPSMLELFLADPGASECTGLRWVASGGEAVSGPLAARFRSLLDGVRLYDFYGPTEAAIEATTWRCGPSDGDAPVPIGRPIPGATAYVLGPRLTTPPPGAVGELCIGGAPVSRGYLGRPARTAAAFVPDPLSDKPGGRLYRTGDAVRQRSDGVLDFIGRLDRQLKVRGFRVEPGEVEAVLGSQADVARSAVIVHGAGGADARLVAYVEPVPGERPAPEGLRAALEATLPRHMVPSAFVVLDEMPITTAGKIDRRALPGFGEVARRGAAELPRDVVEHQLVRLFEDVLDLRPVGIDDDFFRIGGTSLLGVRLIAAIRRRLGHSLPVSALFLRPTPAGLARVLRDAAQASGQRPSPTVIELRPGGGPALFCVHPVGGEALCYLDLARALEDGPAVFGLRAPDDGRVLPGSLGDMAAGYLERVEEARPGEPGVLAGWSMGALVALEMANRKVAGGGEPPLVVLIDPPPPRRAAGDPPSEAALLRSFATDQLRLAGADVDRALAVLGAEPGLDGPDAPAALAAELGRQGVLPADLDPAVWAGRFALYAHHVALSSAYRPSPYPGPVMLACSAGGGERVAAWRELCTGSLEVLETTGDHYDLVQRPRVEELARWLDARLARVGADNDPSNPGRLPCR